MSRSPATKPKRHFETWLVPGLIIAFCVTAYVVSLSFKKMPPILKRGIQPADFPQLLLTALVVLTLAMAWFDPVRVKEKLQGSVWGTLLLMAVFAGLAGLDLFLALGIFAAALSWFWGERRAWVLLLVGAAIPATIFFTFDIVFEIRFPRGILTNLWYG